MRNIKQEIIDNLFDVERQEKVCILRVVESGSRAWGVGAP